MDVDETISRLSRKSTLYDFDTCATRVGNDNVIHPDDVIAAFLAVGPNVSAIAKLVGKRRGTISRWIEARVDMVALMNDAIETKLDTIESLHYVAAEAGNLLAGKFLLQTKGKDRGYVARTEQTGKNGGPMTTEISASEKLTNMINSVSKRQTEAAAVTDEGPQPDVAD